MRYGPLKLRQYLQKCGKLALRWAVFAVSLVHSLPWKCIGLGMENRTSSELVIQGHGTPDRRITGKPAYGADSIVGKYEVFDIGPKYGYTGICKAVDTRKRWKSFRY